MTSLFITGASGFIGGHLLTRLNPRPYEHVFCLSRSEGAGQKFSPTKGFTWLVGSLFDSDVYASCLDSNSVVLHFAATTGKGRREEHFTVNTEGTRHLLAQCRQRGVKNFLYVSTIAVKYRDKSHYYYAQSKQEGEEAVRQSGLNYTVVRPTVVLGKESPGWQALSKLARLPLIVVFGDGRARIQPIDVDDLVDAVISIVEGEDFCAETYDLGGPEVISIEEFLKKVRKFYHGSEPRVMHLPEKPLRRIVALAESLLPGLMPLNAGQLSVFVHDGTIESNALYEKRRPHMKDLNAILKALTR